MLPLSDFLSPSLPRHGYAGSILRALFGVGVVIAIFFSFGRSRLSQSEIFAGSPSDGSAAAGESTNAGVAAFHKDVQPLLAHYCYDCHGNGEKRGNLAFDELRKDDEIINPGLWLKVLKNLRAGIMPPKGQERPTRVQRDLLKIEGASPSAVRTVVRPERVSEIELQIEPRDDREALRAADMLDNFVRLHEAGLFKTELSYDHVDRVAVAVVTKDGRARMALPGTGSWAPSNVRVAASKPAGPIAPFPRSRPTRSATRIAAATSRSWKSPCRR